MKLTPSKKRKIRESLNTGAMTLSTASDYIRTDQYEKAAQMMLTVKNLHIDTSLKEMGTITKKGATA